MFAEYRFALASSSICIVLAMVASTVELPPAQASILPTTGLVGHWAMDGDWTDSSGFANDGTAIGSPGFQMDRNGTPSAAGFFDGNEAVGSINGNGSLAIDGGAISLLAWVKPNEVDGLRWIIERRGGAADYYRLSISGGRIVFGMESGPGGLQTDSSVLTVDGEWHHIAGTYDGSFARIYFDGVEVASAALSGNINDSTATVRIGTNGGGDRFWSGLLDDVAVYDRALSAAEVAQIAEVPSVQVPEPPAFFTVAGLAVCIGLAGLWRHRKRLAH